MSFSALKAVNYLRQMFICGQYLLHFSKACINDIACHSDLVYNSCSLKAKQGKPFAILACKDRAAFYNLFGLHQARQLIYFPTRSQVGPPTFTALQTLKRGKLTGAPYNQAAQLH